VRQLTLKEYEPSPPVSLTVQERDALKDLVPSLTITPETGSEHSYILKPAADIGAVFLPGLAIEIRPKIPIDRVLFLISYAVDPKQWSQLGFAFDESDSLVEAIIPGLIAQLRRAFRSGLLQGYRREEAALMTVRGRIRFEEQLRRRNGVALPIEVAYDDFTEDILENQLILAAIERLRHIRLRSSSSQQSLRHFEFLLQNVSLIPFDPGNLPQIHFSRLNQHYEPAIQLAKLILRSSAIELRHGRYDATAFLVNMNDVFETFVWTAIRETLGLSERQFPKNANGQWLHLDAAEQIALRPDLFWRENSRCVYLGDVKYKRVNDAGIKHADLYQLLAYTIAANVDYGLLIYAAGEGEPASHRVSQLGKMLEVIALDVSGSPDDILQEVKKIAHKIRGQRNMNLHNT